MEWNDIKTRKPEKAGMYLVIIDNEPLVKKLPVDATFKNATYWVEIVLPQKVEDLTPEQAYERAMKVL